MKKIVLLYIALIALGVSAMPNVATLFSNQHTFYKAANMNCITCHADVKEQLDAGGYVETKHMEAALNYNYTTYLAIGGKSYNRNTRNITTVGDHNWFWNGTVWINESYPSQYRNESLDKNGNGAIDGDELCMLCHNNDLLGADAHASTTVVSACDDDRCHGNGNFTYNDPGLLNISAGVSAAGYNISTGNIHSEYYLTSSNQSSNYQAMALFGYTHGNVNNSYVSRGYYVCLGCHSNVSTSVTMILPETYDHGNIDEPKGRYQ